MKKFLKLGLLVATVAVLFTGCRTGTIHNIEANTFVPVSKSIQMDKVAQAIIRAGAGLGWQMKKVAEGEIQGTLLLRDHMAKVKVPYTTKDYSILYQDSANLKYDASANTIHSNYNGWIQNLNNAIQLQLNML